MHVIGIDWAATDETKCGLALAELRDGRDGSRRLVLEELLTGREARDKRSATHIAGWLTRHPDALIALDAPLGWPSKLAQAGGAASSRCTRRRR